AVTLAGYTYFTSSFTYDSWGWTTGPRHLTGLVPFLLLPAGLVLERLRDAGRPWRSGIAAMLCAASVLVTGLATFVNYIPDDVSTPVLALTRPLLLDGYHAPNVLAFLGLPTALAGGLLLAALVGVAATVFLALGRDATGRPTAPEVWGAGLATLVVLVVLQAVFTRNDTADQNAVRFLESVWLQPPGRSTTPFWPRAGS
ncbi:MAG: hypothetical protein EOO71_27545, partial [Myxococcaceae bacterium]